MNTAVKSGSLTWDEFLDEIRRLVPGAPSRLEQATSLDSNGPLDVMQRVAVRQAVALLGGLVPPELVNGIATLGDAFDWCEVRAANGTARERIVTEVGPEHLATPDTRLRPLDPGDLPALYSAALDPRSSFRWRYRGTTPSMQVFTESLYQGTVAQFAIVDRASGSLHGLVAAYNMAPDSGHVYVAFIRSTPEGARRGQMISGLFLFVEYLFRTWPLRKVYAEVPEYNYQSLMGNLGDLTQVEGFLPDHYYFDDRLWANYLIAVYRDRWSRFAAQWWQFIAAQLSDGAGFDDNNGHRGL